MFEGKVGASLIQGLYGDWAKKPASVTPPASPATRADGLRIGGGGFSNDKTELSPAVGEPRRMAHVSKENKKSAAENVANTHYNKFKIESEKLVSLYAISLFKLNEGGTVKDLESFKKDFKTLRTNFSVSENSVAALKKRALTSAKVSLDLWKPTNEKTKISNAQERLKNVNSISIDMDAVMGAARREILAKIEELQKKYPPANKDNIASIRQNFRNDVDDIRNILISYVKLCREIDNNTADPLKVDMTADRAEDAGRQITSFNEFLTNKLNEFDLIDREVRAQQ